MSTEILQKNSKIINIIEQNKIFAVVRTNNTQKTIDISKALIEGGLKMIEIAMSCNDTSLAIKELSNIEGVSIAAGSVITEVQADSAIKAGAKLIVSPVEELRLIRLCRSRKIHIITGAATPNETYNAWKMGVDIIKITPAKVLGGSEYIKDILTLMPFLHLMPAGGVDLNNFTDYLEAGAVAVGIGKALYEDENDFSAITETARATVEKLNKYLEKNNC